jgi:uncharacterized oxidoreductase
MMKLSNNTILITGGSSGIGLALSKVLIAKGNTVIICGKSEVKLKAAKALLPQLITYQCDLADSKDCHNLAKLLIEQHADLNILINNAAVVHKLDFLKDDRVLEVAEIEYQTNLLAPIRLIKLLYHTISTHDNAAIINITTGLVYAPRAIYPFYNACKSALHSFTQTLRFNLREENTKVIEVLFPAVNTPWHGGAPPKIAISTDQAVSEMVAGLEKGKTEIKVGGVKLLYYLSRIAPGFAFKKINQVV